MHQMFLLPRGKVAWEQLQFLIEGGKDLFQV